MFKPHTILGFGLWLIVVSFSGIPATWKIRLQIATGLFLVGMYLYHLGREVILKLAQQQSQNADTFTENGKEHRQSPSSATPTQDKL